MRKVALALPIALTIAIGWSPRPQSSSSADRIRAELTTGMDSLVVALDRLQNVARAATDDTAARDRLAQARRHSRAAYKSIEGLLEYYDGMTASFLNGREGADGDEDPAQEMLEGIPSADSMSGFAGIDAALADSTQAAMQEVEHRALVMSRTVRQARSMVRHIAPTEGQLFDAVRLELARITTLGLGGVDAQNVNERARDASDALRGLRRAMINSLPAHQSEIARKARHETDQKFATAISRLARPTDKEFDSFTIIVDILYPLARAVNAERQHRHTELPRTGNPWRASADFIFDRNAFDPLAYAGGSNIDSSAAALALGQRLFTNTALSGDRSRSCATCHDPNQAFADGRMRARTIDSAGQREVRNTPTLLNVALQPAQFADLKVRTLEQQVAAVIESRSEMRGNLDSAAARLALPRQRITSALATYMRSLTRLDSRFDRAIRGERNAITANERRGFNVFMGKGMCGSCHFAPLFGGTLPPEYWSTPPEVIGVPVAKDSATIDPDLGRAAVDGSPAHRYAFKTPSLRNVAVTAPYMHNGVFRTLEEVVDHYNRGGGAGMGMHLPNQTLSSAKLDLTADEIQDLVSFMTSLTDTARTNTSNKTSRVPRPRL